jgi:hypothetical protein
MNAMFVAKKVNEGGSINSAMPEDNKMGPMLQPAPNAIRVY